METFYWLLPELSKAQWLLHGSIFALNILLFLFARPVHRLLDGHGESDAIIKISRALNILVLVLHVIDLALLRIDASYQHYAINLGLSLMCVYGALFIYSFSCSISKKRFGASRTIEDKTVYFDTYSTRLVDLILLVIIILTTVYVLIKIWGADSMLETTGIFGILVAFLAFTSGIWAPDIISGLIILNTRMLEDGDVVVIDGYPDEYIISKVTLIYVILYDVQNNHRTLIRNSQFTQRKIDNLSRVASTDGLRRALVYKIGYPQFTRIENTDLEEQIKVFRDKVDSLFRRANENCKDKDRIKINENKDFEWALTKTGDYALEYTLWIYLERIPDTKVTSTVRRHVLGTLHEVNERVYAAAVAEGISLSTPMLGQLQIENPVGAGAQ